MIEKLLNEVIVIAPWLELNLRGVLAWIEKQGEERKTKNV